MFNRLKNNFQNYIDARLKVVKYDVTTKVVNIAFKTLALIVMLMCFFSAIFFLNIGLAVIINKCLQSYFWGYVIIAFIYLGICLMLMLSRNAAFWKKLKDNVVEILTN